MLVYRYIMEQMEWVGTTLRHTLRYFPEVSGDVEIVKEVGAVLHVRSASWIASLCVNA